MSASFCWLLLNIFSINKEIVYENAIYTGILVEHEEKGNESWFVLEDYIIEKNRTSYSSSDMNYFSRLVLKVGDAKRIELYYGEECKKIRSERTPCVFKVQGVLFCVQKQVIAKTNLAVYNWHKN